MPIRRTRRAPRRTRRTRRYIRRARPTRALAIRPNPRPVFTETFSLPSLPVPFGGGGSVLVFNMDMLPQLAQYQNLYQKYRILKASVLLVPEFTSFEQNQAENNDALSRTSFGQPRVAWAINDSPAVTVPTSELDVLKDNGCKIRPVTKMLRMACRPVPSTKDANGVQMTLRYKYINLLASGNVDHFGISYWISQFQSSNTATSQNIMVRYVKLTFQLSDPR